jgi:predicted lipoprotein
MRKNRNRSAVWLLIAAIVALAACGKKPKKIDDIGLDRKPMLVNYADNYVIPGYTAMANSLTQLKAKADAFVAAADAAKLDELKTACSEAYAVWQKVDMLEFGPAEAVSLRMYMNTYPVTISKVEANITSGSYDLEAFGNKDAQGFPAMDYLLNGLASTSAATIAFYTTEANAANRRQYLQAVVNKMLQRIEGVKNNWSTYRGTFVDATGTDVNSSLSKMVNSFVLYYERYYRSGKIGLPVGAMTGVAKPELTESYYAPASSNGYAVTALEHFIKFYEGKSFDGTSTGASMKSYLGSIGTKDNSGQFMADVIVTELGQAETKLKALNTPMRDAVQTKRPEVLAIYDELQQVVPLLKVDMVSAFGISITYTDNDGD